MKQFFTKHEIKISRIATVVVFLALVRLITEPFRLQYFSDAGLSFEQIKPFLIGGIITSVGLFAITVLSFYNKHKLITAVAILIIAGLFIVKYVYHLK